jgi:hypothetical protein
VWGPYDNESWEALEDSIMPHTHMMEPPAELLMPLLPYQKQFLSWAVQQVRRRAEAGWLAGWAQRWLSLSSAVGV